MPSAITRCGPRPPVEWESVPLWEEDGSGNPPERAEDRLGVPGKLRCFLTAPFYPFCPLSLRTGRLNLILNLTHFQEHEVKRVKLHSSGLKAGAAAAGIKWHSPFRAPVSGKFWQILSII